MKKLKFIELNYYSHRDINDPEMVIQKHKPSNLFAHELRKEADVILVKHLTTEAATENEGIRYRFFRRSNSFWQIPSATHRFIASEKPDIVLVQGFIFPLQVMALRKAVGKGCRILLQHHGEIPFKRKKIFQRMADKCIDGYLFSAAALALPWISSGIIKTERKCFELPSASTTFCKKDKTLCRIETGMKEGIHFLWAGRLNTNKDPLTVLKAFEKYLKTQPSATLHMIFQENDLLEEIKLAINNSPVLKEAVRLIGYVPHHQVETWYNAADYIISASHHEGGSYVLMEAMACGCVPVVSNIPSSLKITDNGGCGYFFEKGNSESLLAVLNRLSNEDHAVKSKACVNHFEKEMSAGAIAEKLIAIYNGLQF